MRYTTMTNLQRIKSTLCSTINSMSEEKLFEFLFEYEENEEIYFPKGTLFACDNCHALYGDCEGHISDSVNYETCKSRFINYCNLECE